MLLEHNKPSTSKEGIPPLIKFTLGEIIHAMQMNQLGHSTDSCRHWSVKRRCIESLLFKGFLLLIRGEGRDPSPELSIFLIPVAFNRHLVG